jgi:DNA polymerase (family X)
VDLDRVLETARRHGKAVELNAFPQRLDLNDVQARRAREVGARLAIGTDTHVLDHLDAMARGVAVARRGWVEAASVVHTWPAPKLRAWLEGNTLAGSATATRPPRRMRGR